MTEFGSATRRVRWIPCDPEHLQLFFEFW